MIEQPPNDRPIDLTALWLFLVGVFVIESVLRVLPEGYMTRTLQHRAEEIRYLPATSIQVMGDSVSSAIRVRQLEDILGHGYEVSNYSLPGTSPMFNYFVLQRQISAGEAPKLIVFAPHPCTWGDPFTDRFLARFANPREAAQLLRDGVQFDDWLYGLLCRASYTLRYREDIYVALNKGDRGFFQTWQKPVSSVQNTRAKVSPEEQAPPLPPERKLDPRQLPPSLTRPITIHRDNEFYFDRFCELAARHHIEIVWLTLPEAQVFRDEFPGPERTAAYAPFVARMSARHPNLHVISSEIPVLPDRCFNDPWHMNAYGAWTFSDKAGRQLADWLAQHGSGIKP
jgi:hypothetical protein